MIVDAIAKSLRSLLRPSILLILLIPFLASSIFWLMFLFLAWGNWSGFLGDMALFTWMMNTAGDGALVETIKIFIIFVLTMLVFGPLWYLTFILIISVFLFPMLLPKIQKLDYPDLEKKQGGNALGSIKNTLVASVVFMIGFLVSLPLWIFTPLAPFVTLFLTAYLNKQIFSYDVLQDYASGEERIQIKKKYGHELWTAGFVTALLIWVPLANIY
jgi:CysZ protein